MILILPEANTLPLKTILLLRNNQYNVITRLVIIGSQNWNEIFSFWWQELLHPLVLRNSPSDVQFAFTFSIMHCCINEIVFSFLQYENIYNFISGNVELRKLYIKEFPVSLKYFVCNISLLIYSLNSKAILIDLEYTT